jgi:hypothetical protein
MKATFFLVDQHAPHVAQQRVLPVCSGQIKAFGGHPVSSPMLTVDISGN